MKDKKLWVVLLLCIMLFTIGFVHKTFENDTFFTIPTGDYILEHGIDDTEPLTIHEGLKFTKLRWAFDITVSTIYHQFGFTGLYIFTVIMALVFATSLYTVATKLINLKILPAILTMLVVYGCKEYLVCRAQIISYSIFIWEVFFLYRLSRTGKKQYIITLTILSFILLSFHSSVWIVYLVFFLPFIIEWIFYWIDAKGFHGFSEKMILEKTHIKSIGITLGMVLLSGFLTPLGLSPYTYSFKSFYGIAGKFVSELQPLLIENIPALWISLFAFILLLIFTKTKYHVADVLYLFGGIAMACVAERNLYIALPIMTIAMVKILENTLQVFQTGKIIQKVEEWMNQKGYVQVTLFIAFGVFLWFRYPVIATEAYIDESKYPVQAVEYLKKNINLEQMRIYTGYDYGSYLELNGIKVFLDSRSEIYCKEFNDVTILEDWYDFIFSNNSDTNDEIEYIVDSYQLTHVLCYSHESIANYMKESEKFQEIYQDDNFTIYKVILPTITTTN